MKKSIIIIDDEMPSREMLKTIINWEKTEYQIVKEFENGKDALDYYINNPTDYIITDIQMPIMDGIQLIKEIKSINQNQPIIILSCHEKFSYAREAMKYGVKDYLIKDMLTEEDILDALSVAEIQQLQIEKQMLKEVDLIAASRLSSFSLENWLTSESDFHQEEIKYAGYFVLMVIKLASKKLYESYSKSYEDELNQMIKRTLIENDIVKDGFIMIDNSSDIVMLLPIDQIASQIKYIYDCQKKASLIRNTIRSLCDDEVTIGISNGFHSLLNLKNYYEEAKKACQYRMFLGNDKNLFSNTVFNQMKSFNPDRLEGSLQRLEEQLFSHNYDLVLALLSRIYEENIKGFMQYHFIKYVNARMLSSIINYIKACAISYEAVFEKDFIPLNELEEMSTVDDILKWFKGIVCNIRKTRDIKEAENHFSLRVMQAQVIMKEHFKSGIGLHEIAERLGVHKVYLSRIFKEETGRNITQYLQELRIEEVKRLLETTNKPMADIAEELNYSHPQQLSMAFKKETNMTPKAYRNFIYQKKS